MTFVFFDYFDGCIKGLLVGCSGGTFGKDGAPSFLNNTCIGAKWQTPMDRAFYFTQNTTIAFCHVKGTKIILVCIRVSNNIRSSSSPILRPGYFIIDLFT
jgi:hypothetical protein